MTTLKNTSLHIFQFLSKNLIIIIFALAFFLRLGYVLSLEDRWYFFDTIHYDSAAQSIISGDGFGKSLHYYHKYSCFCLEPTYPLFLSFIYAIFGRHFIIVRIIQVLLSLLQLWLLYLIAYDYSK